MTRARKELISVDETPFYHCISRCVRRAYLCGEDYATGQNYEHRKPWLVERLKYLADIFAIDVCAYAVMSNHYHVVLYVNKEVAQSWSRNELIERWSLLFPHSATNTAKLLAAAEARDAENAERSGKNSTQVTMSAAVEVYGEKIEEWRDKLCDISWFMRCLNEYIARRANQEDKCKGRFWEGRFKSQALLDERALLSCMAYVDLNPIRARMAASPETSDFTSIQERIANYAKHLEKAKRTPAQRKVIKQQQKQHAQKDNDWSQASLKPLDGSAHTLLSKGIPFTREEYFKLVDWTGRMVREDKRGAIDDKLPPILKRLGFEESNWIESVTRFHQHFFSAAGSEKSMARYNEARLSLAGNLAAGDGRNSNSRTPSARVQIRGIAACRRLFG